MEGAGGRGFTFALFRPLKCISNMGLFPFLTKSFHSAALRTFIPVLDTDVQMTDNTLKCGIPNLIIKDFEKYKTK